MQISHFLTARIPLTYSHDCVAIQNTHPVQLTLSRTWELLIGKQTNKMINIKQPLHIRPINTCVMKADERETNNDTTFILRHVQ
jgi:hypothetical protein